MPRKIQFHCCQVPPRKKPGKPLWRRSRDWQRRRFVKLKDAVAITKTEKGEDQAAPDQG